MGDTIQNAKTIQMTRMGGIMLRFSYCVVCGIVIKVNEQDQAFSICIWSLGQLNPPQLSLLLLNKSNLAREGCLEVAKVLKNRKQTMKKLYLIGIYCHCLNMFEPI